MAVENYLVEVGAGGVEGAGGVFQDPAHLLGHPGDQNYHRAPWLDCFFSSQLGVTLRT